MEREKENETVVSYLGLSSDISRGHTHHRITALPFVEEVCDEQLAEVEGGVVVGILLQHNIGDLEALWSVDLILVLFSSHAQCTVHNTEFATLTSAQ